MIKINLEGKKREELEELFLRFFCDARHTGESAKYEKIARKYEQAKKCAGYNTNVFIKYGYPFESDKGEFDTAKIKKILLIKPSELD